MKTILTTLKTQVSKILPTVLIFIVPLQACNVHNDTSHSMNPSEKKYALNEQSTLENIQPGELRVSKTNNKKHSNFNIKTIVVTAIITFLLTFGITFGATYGPMNNKLNSCINSQQSTGMEVKAICSNAIIDAMNNATGSNPSVLLDPTVNCWLGVIQNFAYSSSAGQITFVSGEQIPDTTKTTEYIILKK